jgi:hypothetical protein
LARAPTVETNDVVGNPPPTLSEKRCKGFSELFTAADT